MTTLVVLVIGLGLADDLVSHAWGVEGTACACRPDIMFLKAFTNDDGVVNDFKRDPDDDGMDPDYDKDVARCEAHIINSQTIRVTVNNSYPSYTCHFWTKIKNQGWIRLRRRTPVITAPPELTVEWDDGGCGVLSQGKSLTEGFTVHVEQSADEEASYQFTIEMKFVEAKYCRRYWRKCKR